MKRNFYVLFLIIFLIGFVSAVSINPFSYGDSANIESITQWDFMEGEDLHSDILLRGIVNKTYLENNKNSWFSVSWNAFEGDAYFIPQNVEITIFDGNCYPDGDYKDMKIKKCNKTIPYSFVNQDRLTFVFNLSDVFEYWFSIKISYTLKNFVIDNGDYKIIWIDTRVTGGDASPNQNQVKRLLTLPSQNSIIESWTNFEIIDRVHGCWVLETKGDGEAIVWYRDFKEEKKSKISWEYSLIFISIGFIALFSVLQIYMHRDNKLNNWGWFVFGIGCILTGLAGLNLNVSFFIGGLFLILIGTIMFSFSRNQSKNRKI